MSNHFNLNIGNNSIDCLVYTGGICATNGYLLKAPEGAVLFDAPEGILEWAIKERVDPKLLILTHQHFDHVMAAAEFSEYFKCPIWAFAEYDTSLTLESLFQDAGGPAIHVKPYQIDRVIAETKEGEELNVSGMLIHVSHVPGHSPDSICFYVKQAKALFGGDVLFQMSVGRTDFPNGDMDLLVDGIREKIFPLDDEVTVFPGHGPETTIGFEKLNNPFLASS
ncbi:MAG: MBL fold metallo-hydrolase [Akkermansiaceae bacterium]|nr:MBL fold metallo-hydrolase [Akkermansiaceae bacterium]MDG1854216.1 MBL fold metallo-hydrolase [Verrucomicrobiales bacterium]